MIFVRPAMSRPTAPVRMSKAIPIVAPPPEQPKTPVSPSTPTTNKTSTNSSSSNNNNNDQVNVDEILQSLEGKPIHEKKQQLGDRLFPLVKVCYSKDEKETCIDMDACYRQREPSKHPR